MQHYEKTQNIAESTLKAGMDRKAAGKYGNNAGEGPGERERVRFWRTQEDPFAEVWETLEGWLEGNPLLEAMPFLLIKNTCADRSHPQKKAFPGEGESLCRIKKTLVLR
ncbi:MAG: hypothetical protein JJT75_09270 [Opitutales bacterium]|nr:hypothetical protein [Opitutales bacterium]